MLHALQEEVLNYESFISTIKCRVKELLGDDYSVRIYKVIKNNSLELDSLIVLKEGKNFAPNIYLKPYYESYLVGTSIPEIADRLCCIYKQCSVPIVSENFTYDFEDMKPYIIYRLISFDKNRKLLEKVPHIRYLDLAITYHCLIRNDDEGIGTIRISNEHMEQWGINLEELDFLAIRNTKRLFPATIRSMDEVLRSMLYEEFMNGGDDLSKELLESFLDDSFAEKHSKMYILSNQKGINGASCLLYEDVLQEFADYLNSDLFILPSSIHEIILIPKEPDMNREALKSMVEDVNRTQVAVDEVLSDNVYLYSRENHKILYQN